MWFKSSEKSNFRNELEKFRKTPDALLIDVRTEDEYWDSHIIGSINIPLNRIEDIKETIPDKNKPLFVYCHSGHRSGRAAEWLRAAGYTSVTDIGGMGNYNGSLKAKGQL
jgi:rhodanese-related sulfurtransferase